MDKFYTIRYEDKGKRYAREGTHKMASLETAVALARKYNKDYPEYNHFVVENTGDSKVILYHLTTG